MAAVTEARACLAEAERLEVDRIDKLRLTLCALCEAACRRDEDVARLPHVDRERAAREAEEQAASRAGAEARQRQRQNATSNAPRRRGGAQRRAEEAATGSTHRRGEAGGTGRSGEAG